MTTPTRRLRVAMSSYRFDFQGGIERSSYEVAARLGAAGDHVTLLSRYADPVPHAPLHWQQVWMPRHPRLSTPLLYPALASLQLDYDAFDITHNQGGCALRWQDVITAHSCHRAWVELKKRSGETARALLNPRHHEVLHVERANYRPDVYRHVIAVSEGVKREIQQWYDVPADRITVIPNGVDLARFRPVDRGATRAELRAAQGLTDDDVVLLWVGKEFRRKGLGPTIDALAHLPANARLLVVGGDEQAPYDARARALGVRDRITFVGHSDSVHRWFCAADVFVLPTAYEAFALVTLEAAAAGLPLVTTKVNGTEDLVEDGVNGRFVERDGASVAAALEPLVASADTRAAMAKQALASVQDYTWDTNVARTREVYAEVLAQKQSQKQAQKQGALAGAAW